MVLLGALPSKRSVLSVSAAGIICRTSSRSLAGIIGAAGADGTPPSALNPNHHYAYHDPEHSRQHVRAGLRQRDLLVRRQLPVQARRVQVQQQVKGGATTTMTMNKGDVLL